MKIYFRNNPINEPFTFDSIGVNWKQERVTRPKGHPLYHYLQTEHGNGKIVIQGKEYVLNEGEGVLIGPFIRHSYAKSSEEWLTSFATFTGVIESSISRLLGNKQIIFINREQGAQIGALISDIAEKYENSPIDVKSISIDCYRLLMYFTDDKYNHNKLEFQPLYKLYVAPVIKEIETNYNLTLTVQMLSHQVYITPQYLSRLFNRFLGCSAYQYLTTYRINKAKELLLTDTQMEIQKIAQQVGFVDTSHFIAMFKNITGFTPSEFRKLN